MDFDTYENEVVARTGKMEEGVEAAKALGALGLCGEAAEFYELCDLMSVSRDMQIKEIGDVLWYVGYLGRAYGIPLRAIGIDAALNHAAKAESELVLACGRISDVVKKELFHAKPCEPERMRALLGRVLCCLCACARYHAAATIEEVMIANQRKLLARFPNGWDTAAASAKADEASNG